MISLLRHAVAAIALLATPIAAAPIMLRPARVFDGTAMHAGWQVIVDGNRIVAAGAGLAVPEGATVRALPGATLMPGMIEGHSHLLLHPYNETPWDDQVLHESVALRTVRATAAALATVRAGFTTVRDLGTEGAGYADVGLKKAIDTGIVPGPRMIVATRALVATGAYGPRGFEPGVETPLGAEAVDGPALVTAVRRQIGNGADVVKLYADYRWGAGEPSQPTFSQAEMAAAVEAAHSAGRQVTAHASTPEGMRRAILAGVDAIEHGSEGTAAEFKLMRERGVVLCPTLAAGDAIARYRGWKGEEPAPPAVLEDRKAFALARATGVKICVGGDVGVFAHGENAREMLLMAAAGMPATEVLHAATAGNAGYFGLADRGRVAPGLLADLIAVADDPVSDLKTVQKPVLVMKNGVIIE